MRVASLARAAACAAAAFALACLAAAQQVGAADTGPASCDEGLVTQAVNSRGYAVVNGKLKLKGVQLVNAKDQPVQLRGMSSHGLHWFPDCYSKASIEMMVDTWGVNVFRAAMYIGEGGYATNPELNAKRVSDIVQWCEELGIYVIIDWHVLTPGNPNAWLDGEGANSGTAIDYWRAAATAYKEKSHVLYEIANEPNNVEWTSVKAYHDAVISAIRAIDSSTIILAGTTTWSQDIHLAAANPVAQPANVMYAFHFYAGTHESLQDRFRETVTKIPLFVTEFGVSEASGDNGPFLDTTKAFLDLFSGQETGIRVSWVMWSFADKDETSAALQPGACGTKDWARLSCAGKYISSVLRRTAAASAGETVSSASVLHGGLPLLAALLVTLLL